MKYCFSSPFAFSIKTTSRICPKLTWQVMSLFEMRTIIRYLGVLYLFLSCIIKRFRA
jgi:hypothetical protein